MFFVSDLLRTPLRPLFKFAQNRSGLPRFYNQEACPHDSQTAKRKPPAKHSAIRTRSVWANPIIYRDIYRGKVPINTTSAVKIKSGSDSINPTLGATIAAMSGIAFVFIGGIIYVDWYKKNVLDKIELVFSAGHNHALQLATYPLRGEPRILVTEATPSPLDQVSLKTDPGWTEHLRRKEQDFVDHIIHGHEAGQYFILMGPQGSGKISMVFDAMRGTQADGVAMCDAHPDMEVFRFRLGAALNYEFNEDTQTGLFQRRDPREAGPALDIERAMDRLEQVAIRCSKKRGKPLVLVINNIHFLYNNEDGKNLLLQLQQRAESWAASGILTMVFATDEFWPFALLRERASRMHVLSVYDLDFKEALRAADVIRTAAEEWPAASTEELRLTVGLLGGRLAYLIKAARSRDMVAMAKHLLEVEKASVLSRIGLIEDHDEVALDEQKRSSCTWLLLQEFVRQRQEQETRREQDCLAGRPVCDVEDLPLPKLPYWRCREIMKRADLIDELDRCRVIAIDTHHDIRPDSTLIMHIARQVVEEKGFKEKLGNVQDRIDKAEALQRTRELVLLNGLNKGDSVHSFVREW